MVENYAAWFRENASVDERYDYYYSADELEPWVERIKAIAQEAEDTYAVTNNHNLGKAVANATLLVSMTTRRRIKVPDQRMEHYPELHD